MNFRVCTKGLFKSRIFLRLSCTSCENQLALVKTELLYVPNNENGQLHASNFLCPLQRQMETLNVFPLLHGIAFYFYFESCQTCQEISTEDSGAAGKLYHRTPVTFVTPSGWYAAIRQSKQTPPKHMPELSSPSCLLP